MKRRGLLVIVVFLSLMALACGLADGLKRDDSVEAGEGNGPANWPWDDMPLYAAADMGSLKDWDDVATAMRYDEVEGRYFETPDSVEDVHAFYKAEMANHGWTGGENATIVNDFSSVRWQKGDDGPLAIITISTDPDGNVRVMVVRAEKPKE